MLGFAYAHPNLPVNHFVAVGWGEAQPKPNKKFATKLYKGIFMSDVTKPEIRIENYQAPDYLIEDVHLKFELEPDKTTVHSKLKFTRNTAENAPLFLNGEALELISVTLNGTELTSKQYQLTDKGLTIFEVPQFFTLEIVNTIKPHENLTLSGLYQSRGNYCTQCEAHGFRRITYYLDRPDVMSSFTTTIIADKERYPVLLSNGNLIEEGMVDKHRRFVTWNDPFKKPSYLFALVAGDYVRVKDTFLTKTGRTVQLHFYVEKGNEQKCEHAIEALKKAMSWDEKTYGREYDLDIYMIVAVSDFNMGAMENKGLNIFNDKYILARPEIATDFDYEHVDAVVAHEYFHNWSGNRVTCRDWFQLSLKEGLTVFREQQFVADHYSKTATRIDNVQYLRTYQFAEDAGPMAHAVQPRAYIEVNNFYTSTIYNKGSEVIRMIHTLLGEKGFRSGMDLYFERHDGEAVTIEDFVKAMSDANQKDFKQFHRWYTQAGTPQLTIHNHYHEKEKIFEITIEQYCAPTPDGSDKLPFHIPIKIALLDKKGHEMSLALENSADTEAKTTHILELREPKQTFRFTQVKEKPILSLLRDFSAPVKINYSYTNEELIFLMNFDQNGFSRWEASQTFYLRLIDNIDAIEKTKWLEVIKNIINDSKIDLFLKVKLLTLPSLNYLCEQQKEIHIEKLYAARFKLRKIIAEELKSEFIAQYQKLNKTKAYHFDSKSQAERQMKNLCLNYLAWSGDTEMFDWCQTQYQEANNMTDSMAAFSALSHHDSAQYEVVKDEFYKKWQHEALVIDKWFAVQALSESESTLENIQRLLAHPAFNIKNPNKVYALINSFCHNNLIRFHDISGKGYQLAADMVIKLNQINPQVAARVVNAFSSWKKYDDKRKSMMKEQLERIKKEKLASDLYELVTKFLK